MRNTRQVIARRWPTSRVVLLLGASACLIALAACGGQLEKETASSPAHRSVAIIGGSKAERGFVGHYVRRIRAPDLIDVRITPAPQRSKRIWKNRPAIWLAFTTPDAKPDPVTYVRGQWQAMLIAGAIRDGWSTKLRDVRPVAGVTYNRLVGREKRLTDATAPLRSRPTRLPRPATASEVRGAIKARAPELGLDIESVDFQRPLGVAPIIKVQVEDPKEFVATLNEKVAKLIGDLGTPLRIDGFYIEGRVGEEIVEAAVFARRLNTSTGWVNPKFLGSAAFVRRLSASGIAPPTSRSARLRF